MVVFIVFIVIIICLGALSTGGSSYPHSSEQYQNDLNRAKDYFNNPVVNEIRWNRYRDKK